MFAGAANPMNSSVQDIPSTRPYLIRALHEWCTDNGFSPYVAVQVDASVRVPMEFVKNGEIVLNVGVDATSSLRLGNEFIEFKARFGGVARDIIVPISHVIAIYARENGQGMAFPAPVALASSPVDGGGDQGSPPSVPPVEAVTDTSERATLKSVPNEAGSNEPPDPDSRPPGGAPGSGGRPNLRRIK